MLTALLTSLTLAGSVLVVDASGGGDHVSIQDAIDAAASGDTILVRTGFYDSFSIVGKTLTVVEDAGADAEVADLQPGATAGIEIRDLAADQSVVVRGIGSRVGGAFGQQIPMRAGIRLLNNAGPIVIADCSQSQLLPLNLFDGNCRGMRAVNSVSVDLIDTDLHGGAGGDGLEVVSSAVFVQRSSVSGHGAEADVGRGAVVQDGFLLLDDSVVRGGQGASVAVLKLCFYPPLNQGGTGLHVTGSTSIVRNVASIVEGGLGGGYGASQVCFGSFGFPGLDVEVVSGDYQVLAGPSRSVQATSPVREGESWTETYVAEAGDLAFGVLSIQQIPGVYVEPLLGAAFLGSPNFLFFKGAVPPGGVLVDTLTLAELGPGIETITVFLQPLFVEAASLELRLGSPSVVTVFDGAI